MLTLNTNNYELTSMLGSHYTRYDQNIWGNQSIPGMGYIRSKHIGYAMLPIGFNEIGIYQKTYCVADDDHNNMLPDVLTNDYDKIGNTQFAIVRIYTTDVIGTFDLIPTDLRTEAPTAIQELYNKCIDQARLREERTGICEIKVASIKGKHGIYIVTNFDDDTQASDMFLTIGLLPVLCKEWKDKFNEVEIEYFKTLVNRSQVKRISNVKAQQMFDEICAHQKYMDMLKTIRLNMTIENMITNKIYDAQNRVHNCQRNAEQALKSYTEAQALYYEGLAILDKVENKKEEYVEEYKSALVVEGIEDLNFDGYGNLTLTLRVPISFYNVDEAELYVNRMKQDYSTRGLSYERTIQFFEDVFITQKYKLMVVNNWMFNTSNAKEFRKPGAIDYTRMQNYKGFFNPHIFFYNCLGDYESILRNLHAKQDLLMFVNTALASTKSINFRDGAVMNRWRDTLADWFDSYNSNYNASQMLSIKCLQDEEGNLLTLEEVYIKPKTEVEAIELEVQEL